MWPAEKKPFTQEQFGTYVPMLVWQNWRPSKIVWHNTAAPALTDWIKTGQVDQAKGLVPGTTRINNLENYFRKQKQWTGCPHLFIANDFIWVMNPLVAPGVHSPSYNHNSIGIEMIGDFSSEDDDSGEGLRVKLNTIYATAILCTMLGIDPSKYNILLHKEDPKTTHDCPGRNIAIDKAPMLAAVAGLMSGGEHDPEEVALAMAGFDVPIPPEQSGTTIVKGLNLRKGPGVTNVSIRSLPIGAVLIVLDKASNGADTWLKVKTSDGIIGWASGRYVKENT